MLKGKSPDGLDEATTVVQALGNRLAILRQRRASADERREAQTAVVERERRSWRTGLATADPEDDRTTRAALDEAETDLRRIEDTIAGCDDAIRDLEREWKRAKIDVLKVEKMKAAEEVATLQARSEELGKQYDTLRREQGALGSTILRLLHANNQRDAELGELLRELDSAR